MNIITLDFETYYSKAYSLSKMTTEEYIRDPQFQVIGVSAKVNRGPAQWFSGTSKDTLAFLRQFDWENCALLSHNTQFDGAILSWRCGLRPARLLDTMSMSRALHGVNARHSLKALAERYRVGAKGDEVHQVIGMRRADFTPEGLERYGRYCVQDTDLTRQIFDRMLAAGFPTDELKLIDLTLRMFTEPVLHLDVPHLEGHLIKTVRDKAGMLADAGIEDRKDLMSNNRFADLLRELGVDPPRKISPTTGKETYAFSKTDENFQALQEHENPWVQALVAARLGNKSTLEETRTQRFIDIGRRGRFPVPLRYYAAHTGRWGGTDSVNLQNLPSRGPNAKQIKKAILAPPGHMLIECDSSQIEARVLAWLAEQEDLVDAFARREDVYKLTASKIFGVPVEAVDKAQRQIGKVVVLGSGFGVGHVKMQAFLKLQAGVIVDLDEAKRIVDVYRHANHRIVALWKGAQECIRYLAQGDPLPFGRPGVLGVDPTRRGIVLPNGLPILYENLRAQPGDLGYEYVYDTRQGPTRIYGGKIVENVVQALARIVVGQQMLKISKRYRAVLTVHDSVVCCVSESEVDSARAYIEQCMRWTPDWAAGLPVNCESGVGASYGACD
jgi:DNA polymerase I-like protein with 3'-5' exonuclease and polymerase domains